MNKEPITLHLETFNNEEYILADECIEAIGLHRRTNTELHQTIEEKDKEIERLNNDIKELLKENSNKEKVIKIQDNIINKVNEYIKVCKSNDMGIRYQRIEEILQGSDKE